MGAMTVLLLAGCLIKRTAVNVVGDTLAGGAGVYASDNDPELILEAIPFGLKTYESLLEVSPSTKDSSSPRRGASPPIPTCIKTMPTDLT